MPKVEKERGPRRGHWGEPYPQPNVLSRSAEKAERMARTVRDTVVESASAVVATASLPSGGSVALDTLLGWDSNSSNDGYDQGHWNPVTDPRPAMRQRLTEMTTVTWGRMKINFNRLLEQMTAVLSRGPRLLAGKQNSPLSTLISSLSTTLI